MKNVFEFSIDKGFHRDVIKYLRRCLRNKPLKQDELETLKLLVSEMVCDTIECKVC